MYGGFGFTNVIFQVFPIIFGLVFLGIMAVIIVSLVKGISQWGTNNRSPVLTVDALIVAKRMNVTHHHRDQGTMDTYTNYTTYYATFQVESGDRMELSVSGDEYGMLAEGDMGKLKFQGTRYLGFERNGFFDVPYEDEERRGM